MLISWEPLVQFNFRPEQGVGEGVPIPLGGVIFTPMMSWGAYRCVKSIPRFFSGLKNAKSKE